MHETHEHEVKPGPYMATVESVRQCSPGLWDIQCHAHVPLDFVPGQVIRVLSAQGDAFLALSSSPAEMPKFSLLLRLSEGENAPLPLETGGTFAFDGPWGKGFELSLGGPLWLIGAGSALGALRSAWRTLLTMREVMDVRIVAAVRQPEALCFADELSQLASVGASVHVVTSRAPAGATHLSGHVQDHLENWLQEGLPNQVCLVGSEGFEDSIRAALMDLGLSYEAIQLNYRPDARDVRG